MASENVYENSTIISKLRNRLRQKLPLKLAFLDIDSTMTGGESIAATHDVRNLLEKMGYMISFVTSKTEDMLITEEQRAHSPSFTRPLPHLGVDEKGKRFYTDPKHTEPMGILDPDVIMGSTGTNILLKQIQGGYEVDTAYRQSFPPSKLWRSSIIKVIEKINSEQKICQIHPNEFEANYTSGKTNVFPPDYRVEVRFKTVKNKQIFLEEFKMHLHEAKIHMPGMCNDEKISAHCIDDSNPEKEKYTLLITPQAGPKVHAVEHVVEKITTLLQKPREEFEVLLAGDSYPDLAMGLYGGKGTEATFLLVGKSRLATYLVDESVHDFADESLKEIKKKLVAVTSKMEGTYEFVLHESGKRTVLIGDELYPNTTGPETILAFLKDKKN